MNQAQAARRQVDQWWRACLAQGGGLPPGVEPVQTRLVRAVGRAELPDCGPVYLKVMGFPRAKDRLRYSFRALPARHEARMLERLAAAGLCVPEVVAVRTSRRFGLPRLSLLVLRALPAGPATAPFPALCRAAAALVAAGVYHPDLNRGNLHPLPGGEVAILDLQSARMARPGLRPQQRLQMAAKLWVDHGAAGEQVPALQEAGLVAAAEVDELRRLGARVTDRQLIGRIGRCFRASTDFEVRRRWTGVEYRRRGDRPAGLWVEGGTELVRCWIGDRTLEVLDGGSPRMHGFFRKSWWFPGLHSAYIAGAAAEGAGFQSAVPGLLEGYERFRRLRNGPPHAGPVITDRGTSTGRV